MDHLWVSPRQGWDGRGLPISRASSAPRATLLQEPPWDCRFQHLPEDRTLSSSLFLRSQGPRLG